MSETSAEAERAPGADQAPDAGAGNKQPWESPRLEDVSEQVMAQPYIRFT